MLFKIFIFYNALHNSAGVYKQLISTRKPDACYGTGLNNGVKLLCKQIRICKHFYSFYSILFLFITVVKVYFKLLNAVRVFRCEQDETVSSYSPLKVKLPFQKIPPWRIALHLFTAGSVRSGCVFKECCQVLMLTAPFPVQL